MHLQARDAKDGGHHLQLGRDKLGFSYRFQREHSSVKSWSPTPSLQNREGVSLAIWGTLLPQPRAQYTI